MQLQENLKPTSVILKEIKFLLGNLFSFCQAEEYTPKLSTLFGNRDIFMDHVKILRPLNYAQEELFNSFRKNTITIAYGSAGTGKTLCAMSYGLNQLSEGNFEQVVYVRPDVATDYQRGHGAVPGELIDKSKALLGPVMDNISECCKPGIADYLLKHEKIKYIYLEDIRGRSLQDSFIIFDEAQNCTPKQMLTVLTRIGKTSQIAVCGDTSQVDVFALRKDNGLSDAIQRLSRIPGVGTIRFGPEHCVRSGILKDIMRAYEN